MDAYYRIRVLAYARCSPCASLVSWRQSPQICISGAGLVARCGFRAGVGECGTLRVVPCNPGPILVLLLATSPGPSVDYRGSLRANPTPDLFCHCGMVDESWSGGGELDSSRVCGARRAPFSAADPRGGGNDVETVRRRIPGVYDPDGATFSGVSKGMRRMVIPTRG